MNPLRTIAVIKHRLDTQLKDKFLFATGDLYQLRSIQESVNQYYENDFDHYMYECVSQIFDYSITLKKNKRCVNESDARRN